MSYISKWRLQNNSVVPIGSNLFGTCNSGSSDTTKVVSLSDFNVLVEGVTIHVYFANANSGSNTLLQVGSTSAQPIKRNGIAEGKWENGSVISFTYSQGYWVQNDADVGGIAETYTLSKNGDTITLTGSGGDTSSVTDDDTTYTFSISGHTLTITSSNGTPQTIILPDDDTTYTLSISGDVLTLTGSDGSTYTINLPKLQYTIDGADGLTTNNVIQNDVTNNVADGGYALAQGQGTTASGVRSHAEGYRTTASGSSSHAEGLDTEASGNHSHAEGNATEASGSGSHAEGSHTEASNDQAHAEGYYSVASAPRSHANHYTIAQRADQTAIGRFNEADTTGADETELGEYAFIIGNGTADNARSNAFTVDWEGNVNIPAGADFMINGVPIGSGNTYTLTKIGNTITLTGSGGDVSAVVDEDTPYTKSISGDVLTLTPSSGSAQTVTLPIPTKTSDLTNDSDFVSDANYVHTDNNFTTAEKNKLSGIEAGAEVNVQANWNETDSTSDAYIQNKPTISPQNLWYGTCGTGASTQAKVVTTSDGDFTLTTGNMVRVKFTNAQTYNGTVTLNVDGTGAVDVARVGTTKTTRYYWVAGEVVDFVYDGTNFVMSAKGTATTTYYGLTKLSSSINSTSTALAATPNAVKQAYDLADSKQDELVPGTNIKTITGVSVLGSGDIVTPDDDTTYTLSISGNVLTLTPSSGSPQTVNLPDDDTTYTLSISGNTLTLTGSDGSTSTATVPDDDTTYTLSISGNDLILTPSSGTAQTITLPIPTKTSDLTNDSNFVSDANYVHTDNNFTTAEKNKLSGIEAGAEANVQSDWNQTNSSADDYIKNKPTIPTPPSPSSTTPLMDGTASVGSEANYARGDHRHPSDTSKQDTLVSGTNIKTINGNSLLGSGNIVIPGGGGTSDYDSLTNRPQINSVTLTGNKSFADLGLIDFFYPVGSYYETSDSSFDPNVTWGGTWVLEADGLVHIGAGNRYPVGDTGGEETHMLTVNEMPAHAHNTKGEYVYYGSGSSTGTILLWANGSAAVQQTGGNVPHNIMQPYVAVNRWHRTA